MAHLLAYLVLAGFGASMAFFYVSIFRRGRSQQWVGMVWAGLGLLGYAITFGDRLWLGSAHKALALLPFAGVGDTHFVSPVWVIGVLLALYVLRGIVFWTIFDPLMRSGADASDELNDLVAPFLSFVAFGVVLDTALASTYRFTAGVVVGCVALTAAAYGVPTLVRLLVPWYEVVRSWVVERLVQIRFYVFLLALQIHRLESWRRGVSAASWEARVRELRERTAQRVEEERGRRAESIAKAVDRGARFRRPRSGFGYHNPNER